MADNIYQKAFSQYGESPKSLHWVNYESQAVRFKYLVKDVDLENKTILDAGCGMGDLLPFIYSKATRFSYLGVDINEDFINAAKKRYAGHRFKIADPFFGKFNEQFEVVLSSGVMNENIPNWLNVRKEMIASLYRLCSETLVFNMAGGKKYIPEEGKIAYADADEIVEYCKTIAPRVALDTSYSYYDFTVVMQR